MDRLSVLLPVILVAGMAITARGGEDDGLRRSIDAYLDAHGAELRDVRPPTSPLRAVPGMPGPWIVLAVDGAPDRVPETKLPETTVEAATLTRRPLSETVPSMNVVTRDDVQRKLPLGVPEALHWEPGIWSTQGSSGWAGTPVIRGWQGNQVLLLLDGIRLTRDRTPTGPGSDWEILDPHMVDRIEVLRTPDSVLYGTGAIGGVTALYTEFPVDFTESGTVYGGNTWLDLASGGLNHWRWRLEGHTATPTVRATLAGTLYRSNNIHAADGVEYDPTDIDTNEVDGHVEWKADDVNTLGFWFFVMRKIWDGDILHPSRVQDNSYEREVVALRWRNTAGTSWWDDVEVQVGLARWKQVQDRSDVPDRRVDENWVPQATVTFHKACGERHAVTYGLGTYVNTTDNQRTRDGMTLRGVPKGTVFDLGVFAQDEWKATNRLRVVYGVRLDGVWAETHPDAATTDPLIEPDDIRIDQSELAWTGKVGLRYQATDEVALTGNFSRGYRFPSLSDLGGFVQAPDEIIVGDPTTTSEYSNTIEGGIHYASPRWRGSLVTFVSWYQDAIIRTFGEFKGMTFIDVNGNGVEDNDEDIYLTTNAGEARYWGIEAAAVVDVDPHWAIFGNLTLWDGKITPDPTEPIGIPINGTLGVNYHPTDRCYVQVAAHMVARFDMIPEAFYNAEAFFFRDPQDEDQGTLRGDHSIPGYTLFDIRLGLKLSDRATATIGVDNLLDKKYRRFGDRRNGPGFTVLCGLSFDF